MDILKYKDYSGTVEYSDEDNCYVGQVMGLRSCIIYEGETIEELKSDFETAIDDYIRLCKNYNRAPETPSLENQQPKKKSFFTQLRKTAAVALL